VGPTAESQMNEVHHAGFLQRQRPTTQHCLLGLSTKPKSLVPSGANLRNRRSHARRYETCFAQEIWAKAASNTFWPEYEKVSYLLARARKVSYLLAGARKGLTPSDLSTESLAPSGLSTKRPRTFWPEHGKSCSLWPEHKRSRTFWPEH
jgi:hypothetical protein